MRSGLRNSEQHAELGEHVYKVIQALNEATFKILKVILYYVPIGIFAILAETIGKQGLETILSLGNMIVVLYIALFVQVGIYLLLLVLFKTNPIEFFKYARTPMITAFATQSSSGTLPLTLDAGKNLGLFQKAFIVLVFHWGRR
ncbi:dicarboxylate/amino acid:cation symporter [Pseudalkalibacillus sp. A8]|uniref:dicarboxylate/amino acid:cation symporter n=1 Tax=Pseudalkalibacillus sp. A8 TaxID=3382641 RepID=UPI0038B63911